MSDKIPMDAHESIARACLSGRPDDIRAIMDLVRALELKVLRMERRALLAEWWIRLYSRN